VDEAKLLAFLEARKDMGNPVVYAVYQGLIDRIRRGEFR
jgi:hypothetical protein